MIVAAAWRIADESGVDGLTLREVAAALDTGQASLYRHIADRRELLALLADEIAVAMPRPDPSLPPAERLPAAWLAMHAYLAAHSWAARVIVDGELLAHDAVMITWSVIAAFEAAGHSRDTATRAYRALFNLMLGHLLNRHPLGHGDLPGEADFEWALRVFLAGLS
jgi:AcrR family transcriptional regulator